jgi:hypothetical protein
MNIKGSFEKNKIEIPRLPRLSASNSILDEEVTFLQVEVK